MPNLQASVIIPTLNRKKYLLQTLGFLKKQNFNDFEVIIVDQSEKELRLKEEELKYSEDFKKRIKILYLDKKNLPNARNVGAQEAKGEILIFIDDDVIIKSKNFVENHLKNYSNPKVVAVAGRLVQPFAKKSDENKKPESVTNFLFIIKGNFSSKLKMFIKNTIPGGNFSVRRDFYFKIGGFDKNFIGNALFEDTDFGIRITKNKGLIIFDPATEVFHLAASRGGVRNNDVFLKDKFYWFYHNYVYLYCKHGNDLLWPVFLLYLFLRSIYHCFKYKDLGFLPLFFKATFKGIKFYNASIKK
ncbi:MAG: glycosyltransferase [Candidatus Pacebacteria bacterium]|nr:glycosyltransferase [Candidatus Paceibacterota bacterium]